jgi:hypothetical protein
LKENERKSKSAEKPLFIMVCELLRFLRERAKTIKIVPPAPTKKPVNLVFTGFLLSNPRKIPEKIEKLYFFSGIFGDFYLFCYFV